MPEWEEVADAKAAGEELKAASDQLFMTPS
jgi:hypothetical protein